MAQLEEKQMAKKDEREIIRTVSLNGELFTPGMEDELEEALKDHADNNEDYDHKKNIDRLTKQGAIVGFGSELKEDEIEETDADRAATRRSRNGHLLQSPEPLARGGPPDVTMDDIRDTPDRNVVEMHLAGGPKEHAKEGQASSETSQKLADATDEAHEQLDEAHVQQESDQVPAPEGTKSTRKSTRSKK